MSENTQKEKEQTIQETQEVQEEQTAQETQDVQETPETQEVEKKAKKIFQKKEKKSKTEELELKIKELEDKVAKDKDDYIRLMAEFDNYRRRTSQEKLELVSVASMDTIKGLLPVLDDCERALAVLKESNDSDAAKEGTELIYNKLMTYLKSKGLAVIEAVGQPFDTDLHEAVAQFPVPEEDKKGKVFDVVQTGYTLNGKVIRFAKVVVGI